MESHDSRIDLNKMPYLCEDCRGYLHLSPKEDVYITPPTFAFANSGPSGSKDSRGSLLGIQTYPRSLGDQLLCEIHPSCHELFKCLLPNLFESPCSPDLLGFSNTRAYEGTIPKMKFPKIKDEKECYWSVTHTKTNNHT